MARPQPTRQYRGWQAHCPSHAGNGAQQGTSSRSQRWKANSRFGNHSRGRRGDHRGVAALILVALAERLECFLRGIAQAFAMMTAEQEQGGFDVIVLIGQIS